MKSSLLLLLMLNTAIVGAQNSDPWSAYMTPSDIHTFMAGYAGDFKMEISMSMGEAIAPVVVTVDSEHSMLLGGRFLEMKQKGVMAGMDYQAISTLGYNNSSNKFSLTTITNMGTGILSMKGNWDEESKSATLYGQMTNPVSKDIIDVRQVLTFVDGDTILIESFDKEGDTPEVKTVVYTLTRKG